MRFMISGYGTGSRTGGEEKPQFRTLRVSTKLEEGYPTHIDPGGVIVGGKPVPSMKINGTTRKVNKETDDNNVSLIFHSMTVDEAMKLSADFARFATYLAEARPEAAKSVSTKTASEFANQVVRLLTYLDKSSFSSLFAEIFRRLRQRKLSVLDEGDTPTGFQLYRPEVYAAEQASRVRKWLETCAQKVGGLLHHWEKGTYVDDDGVERPLNLKADVPRKSADIIRLRPEKE